MTRLHCLVLLTVLLLAGCGQTREVAKSTLMGSQASEVGQAILTGPELQKVMEDERVPEDVREVVRVQISKAIECFTQGRHNLEPAINLLSDGEALDTGWTTDQAAITPLAFIEQAKVQETKAATEVQGLLWWKAAFGKIFKIGSVTGGLMANIALAVTGTGTIAGVGLWIARALKIKDKVQVALAMFAHDAAKIDPKDPDALEDLKTEHMLQQLQDGIHKQVAAVVAKTKAILTEEATTAAFPAVVPKEKV